MTDRELGENALSWYYKEGIKYNITLKNLGFAAFIDHVDGMNKSFISGLGLGISFVDSGKAQDSLEAMARNARGKLPPKVSMFTQAVQQGQTSFNFSDFVNVAKSSGSELLDYTQEVSTNIKDGVSGLSVAAKYAKYFVPFIGIGLIYYYSKPIMKVLKKMGK